MSNSKGNVYPVWGVNPDFEVFAIDSNGQVHSKSAQNFAFSVCVSEDGTVWVLSTQADPDGGGAKLYWSNGDGNWTEITTDDPGGISISGGQDDTCIYLSTGGDLRLVDTNSNNKSIYQNDQLIEFDYGGSMIWALFPKSVGKIATLHYADYNALQWKEFEGGIYPYSLSVDYDGNCHGIEDFNPMYYSKDGKSSGSGGSGADGKSLQYTFKNWSYVLSTDANQDGNLILEWVDEAGGQFQPTANRASKIAASYFHKGG